MKSPEHLDVLIVGAGLSGIGAACHLQTLHPAKSYVILESRSEIGGTWSLFQYPGIRSDSDMYTFGYSFRPWTGAKAISDGGSILEYLRDTAKEHGVDRHIHFNQRVVRACWSSTQTRWLVEVEVGVAKEISRYTCNFLYVCSGYYDYDKGYSPSFPGQERFQGQIVHPQDWPQDIRYAGKHVVVIGSGATAVTLVPALATEAAHVTMLQRSPSYITALPAKDVIAELLRTVLPARMAYRIARTKVILVGMFFYQLSRRFPRVVRTLIRRVQQQHLPPDYAIDTHFKPNYNPWDQRVCVAPDGDFFKTIKTGHASVVTDHVEQFIETGIRLKSGKTLRADIIVTATGLKLKAFGGVRFAVDGVAVDPGAAYTYNGVMLGNVPNMAFCVGYTNASWTLRADLSSRFICRLLTYMDRHGYRQVEPRADAELLRPPLPLLSFTSGYVLRSLDQFPKQSARVPWRLRQNYVSDLLNLRLRSIEDGTLRFSRGGPGEVAGARPA
ncbi:MAG TPA: NAD(P)/FAD-dependent oxidoreductase [Steroidobacteraceae bacterium]|nr:NAD(P)/FAD-dependent oxidoreductase [Steroidobacteraceae bacterium]